ncbi:T9SS type A sorting domain-containing protein [Flavobacterium caeni]|uniref:Por secretion system C-terminal sorting domain-containing protein n=1 Tax=Flavobacterium caeni TaxID=490189 RepID=A0A1G5G608_9FLAO|nr:T9SS type A sorting domain-containing protein [Flavobacterium caeni]SCY46710.1 Por secretion system C-terminal sorting domain-containing protein [Flavobacterium caeni]
MKKLYTLSLLLVGAAASFAQPIITGIMDGDCAGGNPKVLEIYANGTVDFGAYSVENQTNATAGTWGQTMSLAPLGSKTNAFVYVVHGDPAVVGPVFAAEFAGIPSGNVIYSGVGTGVPQPMNVNGDDRLRLIETASTTVVDQFGTSDTDGTGLDWEYLDSWAKRNNGTTASGSNFNSAQWTYGGVAALDTFGTCQTSTAFSELVPFGTFALATKQFNIAGLKVYPNPAKGGNLFITSDSNETKSVAIYNVLGKQVLTATVNNAPINVSNLSAGVYIVKVTEAGKTATKKLVIE